ncbi:unnamed protein product, partial [Heterosigma akashiwo]
GGGRPAPALREPGGLCPAGPPRLALRHRPALHGGLRADRSDLSRQGVRGPYRLFWLAIQKSCTTIKSFDKC